MMCCTVRKSNSDPTANSATYEKQVEEKLLPASCCLYQKNDAVFVTFYLPHGKHYDTISLGGKQLSAIEIQRETFVRHSETIWMLWYRRLYGCRWMGTRYFVVKEQAVPEVLLKVVEAKKLLDTGRVHTINEAADRVGISRSSFYKYKDDIFQFHDNSQGTTITLTFQMEDEPGLLSDVLKIIAQFGANILTIHQSIPINGVASLSLSVQVLPTTGNVSEMLEAMEHQKGVRNVKILAKE